MQGGQGHRGLLALRGRHEAGRHASNGAEREGQHAVTGPVVHLGLGGQRAVQRGQHGAVLGADHGHGAWEGAGQAAGFAPHGADHGHGAAWEGAGQAAGLAPHGAGHGARERAGHGAGEWAGQGAGEWAGHGAGEWAGHGRSHLLGAAHDAGEGARAGHWTHREGHGSWVAEGHEALVDPGGSGAGGEHLHDGRQEGEGRPRAAGPCWRTPGRTLVVVVVAAGDDDGLGHDAASQRLLTTLHLTVHIPASLQTRQR